MSGAVLFIKEDLKIHELQEEVPVGSLNLISLVDGVLAGRLSDSIGRKKTMAIASVIFFLGAGVMGLTPNFGILLGGRIVAGIGVGFGLMIAPVYTAELAPAASRGALVSFPETFINLGILLGYIVSYLLSG
ncbi:probable polyol transporter 4 [Selaginella moellendorffii]|nr:probable polyol transporter 4 [Selaginella moellendorffii]|eukprot:XP_002984640.2 probable polyol transporter 4 [Selaginella moellendorffii]